MKKAKNLDITNRKSIQNMINYLEGVKSSFPEQCKQFCEELATVGIKAAIMATTSDKSGLSNLVVFAKEMKIEDKSGCSMIMYGRNIRSVFGEDANAAEVSPILMIEFGSGPNGAPPQSLLDGQLTVGQGSFPGQTHAFDTNGWWYKSTRDGEWHHSYGIVPCYPMQNAYDKMVTQVDKIARSCFRL